MDKPWYRELFGRHQNCDSQAATARAEDGDAEAQFGLGLKFASSEGDAHDFVQAVRWYRKAADQNHSLAQFNLGMMYAKGQGVTQNDGEAAMWIRRAAEQGDAAAQFNLGTRYHRASVSGQEMDVAESRIEAYKWLQLAAAQGYHDSESACEPVTLRMTREDVVEGNERVAAFVAASSNTLKP